MIIDRPYCKIGLSRHPVQRMREITPLSYYLMPDKTRPHYSQRPRCQLARCWYLPPFVDEIERVVKKALRPHLAPFGGDEWFTVTPERMIAEVYAAIVAVQENPKAFHLGCWEIDWKRGRWGKAFPPEPIWPAS